MFKKLDKEDLEELKRRIELINSYILTAQALEVQKQAFIDSRLSKYGLDSSLKYEIDLKSGRIKVVKKPTKQNGNT